VQRRIRESCEWQLTIVQMVSSGPFVAAPPAPMDRPRRPGRWFWHRGGVRFSWLTVLALILLASVPAAADSCSDYDDRGSSHPFAFRIGPSHADLGDSRSTRALTTYTARHDDGVIFRLRPPAPRQRRPSSPYSGVTNPTGRCSFATTSSASRI